MHPSQRNHINKNSVEQLLSNVVHRNIRKKCNIPKMTSKWIYCVIKCNVVAKDQQINLNPLQGSAVINITFSTKPDNS